MSSPADYDRFEKIFAGTWKFVREENMDAMKVAYEPTEKEMELMSSFKPDITFSRQGSKINTLYQMGDTKFDISFSLGEEFEYKDDPDLSSKTISVMKGDKLCQDVVAIPSNKKSTNTLFVSGDELITETIYNGTIGRTIHKRA